MTDLGTIAIKDLDGEVIVDFYEPVQTIAFTPHNALGIAAGLAEAAYAADGRPNQQALKDAVIEQKRLKLVRRVELMLGSMQGHKLSSQSQKIVDAVLSEIL